MSQDTAEAILKFVIDTREATAQTNAFYKKMAKDYNDSLVKMKKGAVTYYLDPTTRKAVKKVTADELQDVQKGLADQREARRKHLELVAKQNVAARLKARNEADADLKATLQRLETERSARAKIYAAMRKDEAALAKANAPAPQPRSSTKSTATATLIGGGKAGRVAAGAATMFGQYQVAGGMYAAANIMDAMDIKISKTTALLGGLATTVPLALGGVMLYGRELNKELANMSTLLMDSSASAQDLDRALSQTVDSAARNAVQFNTDVVEVVKAYKQALSSGIEKEDLERFGRSAGTLATALGEDFGSAVNILTTFKDTYNLSVGELERVNDVLFNIVDKGKVNTKEMLSQLGRILAPAQAAGLSFEQLGGAYATMTRGMKNTQAVTSIGRIIADITSPGKQAADAFRELGVSFGSTALEGRGFMGFIDELIAKTGGDAGLIARMFPEIQTQRGIAFLIQTRKLLGENTEAMFNMGTATTAANRQLDTLWGTIDKVTTKVGTSLKTMGSNFADTLDTAFKYWRWKTGADKQPANNTDRAAAQLTSIVRASGYDQNSTISNTTGLRLKQQLPDYIMNKFMLSGGRKENGEYVYLSRQPEYMEAIQENLRQSIANEKDNKYGLTKPLSEFTLPQVEGSLLEDEKKSAIEKAADRERQKDIRARATEADEERLSRLREELADHEADSVRRLAGVRDELTAQLTKLEGEYEAQKAIYSSGGAEPTITVAQISTARKNLADLYERNEGYERDFMKTKQLEITALEEMIRTQRKSKDIQDEENARKESAARDERLDNMRDKHELDLQIAANNDRIAALKAQPSTKIAGVGPKLRYNPKTGKLETVPGMVTNTTTGAQANAGEIARLEAENDRLRQAKWDRQYEHASYQKGGSGGDGSGGGGYGGFSGAGGWDLELKTRLYEKSMYTNKITDQDFYKMKEMGYTDAQLARIQYKASGSGSNAAGSGSDLLDEYVKMTKTAEDKTLEAFKSIAQGAEGMAVTVINAWNQLIRAVSAGQNSSSVTTNVPVTINTQGPTVNPKHVAGVVQTQLAKDVANGTKTSNYPSAKKPPTAGSTATGTMTSKKGTVAFVGQTAVVEL